MLTVAALAIAALLNRGHRTTTGPSSESAARVPALDDDHALSPDTPTRAARLGDLTDDPVASTPTAEPLTDDQAAVLLEEAVGLASENQIEPAIERLKRCVRSTSRSQATCYASMGPLYEYVASHRQSAQNVLRARTSIQHALALAASTDTWVASARQVLEATVADERAAEDLLSEARGLVKRQALEEAVTRLEECARLGPSPTQPTCQKVLGSTYAKLAARNNSKEQLDRARHAYERFLELAAPDDESVRVVQGILAQTASR
jgi:tetratricopeptide (TPR) repeat protein